MARYKTIDTSPRFLAVDLERQLLPGTFEHAIHHLLEREIDLSGLDARYRNDATGATAYPPATLLKLVLFAYSQGIVSSRAIERMCRDHVTFIALSGDSQPHFTTIADKLEAAARTMLERHRSQDEGSVEPDLDTKERKRIDRLQRDAAELRQWLADHPQDRCGPGGSVRKSNRTDNDSAKMATSKGVIQGYCGVAAVDDKHQIIIEAQAHGTGSEQELLMPIVDALGPHMVAQTLLTADAGYHSEANLKALEACGIDALIADNAMRQRDERFADQARHQAGPDPLHDKSAKTKTPARYTAKDFTVALDQSHCICPAGKKLYRNGKDCTIGGYAAVKFRGALRDCGSCPLRVLCLRKPETTKTRQVAILHPQGRCAAQPHPTHASTHRQRTRQGAIRRPLRDRRTGVRQSALQQEADAIHTARPQEGRHAVEPLLHGPQHRETRQQWIRTMKNHRRIDARIATCRASILKRRTR